MSTNAARPPTMPPDTPPNTRDTQDTDTRPWHALAVGDALVRARSSRDGLSGDEVAARRATHGPNALAAHAGDGPVRILWRQIDNPLIWVLIGAAILALALGKGTDGLVVLAVVVLNTIIGFVQEYRASRAIEALSRMVPEHATAIRDSHVAAVPVPELVPGDIVILSAGDKVPADARLLHLRSLQVEEAALTGESVPVAKQVAPVSADAPVAERASMVFRGTLVASGTGTAMVTAIGPATELGRISTLLEQTTELETPLTRALAVIGRRITAGILVLALLMIAAGTARAMAAGAALAHALRDTVVFAIALAVGAIPEGLPAIVTIALAIGVRRMAARRAIIRKLPAVETLGSTTVICTDKTGTLTRNEMTVVALWTPARAYRITGTGYAPEGEVMPVEDGAPEAGEDGGGAPEAGGGLDAVRLLLREAVLCSDATVGRHDGAWRISGDPTEAALVVAAEKAGVGTDEARRTCPRRDAIPFASEQQFMAALHAAGQGGRIVLKGAPEVVLARCATMAGGGPGNEPGNEIDRDRVLAAVETLAGQGLRVLAMAARDVDADQDALAPDEVAGGFELLGLVGMIDPPRPEVITAMRTCREAGIQVKMITGDHRVTAEAIGRQIGLLSGLLSGPASGPASDPADAPASEDGAPTAGAMDGAAIERLDDARLRAAVRTTHVFARVAPEHKLRLVRALQEDGQVVAMTGDGVNDAPALDQANIGVAMGITGTAVAREAADIVLTDDNFASIAAAVEEGRRVYDNLIKSLIFVLPTNLGLALILMSAVVFFPFDPATGSLLLPLLPTQLLWINLVAAVTLALPLAFEAKEPGVMQRPPRKPDAPVLSRFVLWRTGMVALLMAAGAIAVFVVELDRELSAGIAAPAALSKAQSMVVTTIIMFQVFYMLSCRSLRGSIWSIGVFSNPVVFLGIAAILLLQAAFLYGWPMQQVFETRPLGLRDIGMSVLAGALIMPVIAVQRWRQARHEG